MHLPSSPARRAALAVAALTVVAGSAVTAAAVLPTATSAPDPVAASADDERGDELDRLVELFTARADAHDEALDHRAAGEHLLLRAGRDADVGDYAAAVDRFTRAAELDPDDPQAQLGLGRSALGVHRFADARAAADAVLARDPASLDAAALAGDASFAVGDLDDARRFADTLGEARPDDPAVLVRRSQVALADGDDDVARRLAADAVSQAEDAGLEPVRRAFYESFAGHQAYELADYDTAERLLEAAVDHAPADHGALGELARLRAATGDDEAAIALLDRANALVPEPDHLVLAGDLRARAGDDGAAAENHRRAVEEATRDADHARAWRRAHATYLLDHGGDLDEALRLAEAELDERHDGGAWDLVAWAHFRRGELDEAHAAATTALTVSAPDATTLFHAGAIAAERGDDDEARMRLRAAIDRNPGFDPVLAPQALELLAGL